MANNFNLGIYGDDTEAFLEVFPEKLTNEELLELKQEYRAEEEAREKEITEEEKEPPPQNLQ